MPMDASALSEEIEALLTGFNLTDSTKTLVAAIATAVVAHIIKNAEVSGGTPTGPISGGKIT